MSLPGLDPFGTVNYGYMEIRGKVKSGLIRVKKDDDEGQKLYVYSVAPGPLPLAEHRPDDPNLEVLPEFDIQLHYLGEDAYRLEIALAFKLREGSLGEYRRIGFASNHYHGTQRLKSYFEDSCETVLRVI